MFIREYHSKNDKVIGLSVSKQITPQALHFNFEHAVFPMAFISRNKAWIDANQSLCVLLGYTRQELQKKTWDELTHPDDVSVEAKQFNQLFSDKIDEYTIDKRFVRKDGSLVNVRLIARGVARAEGVLDCVAFQMENMTEKLQTESLLQHYESQVLMLTALIDTAHDPVMVVDIDSKLQFANAAGYELLNDTKLLKTTDGKIGFVRFQHQNLLNKAILQAITEAVPTEIVLPNDEQTQKWWMTVVPLKKAVHLRADFAVGTAMVVLHDSSAKTHHISEYLRQGYGLKAAEIRLAEALAKGMAPEEYAISVGLQISTIRTQLRSVFIKTGTKRQADLVRLMSDVPRVRREVVESPAKADRAQSEQEQPTISMLTHRIRQMDLMDRITQMSLSHDEPEAMLRGVLDLVREYFDADRAGLLYPCDPEAATWSSFMESTKPEWVTPIPIGTITPMTPEVQKLFKDALTAEDVVVYDATTTNQIPEAVVEKYLTRSQMLIALKPKVGKAWLFGLVHCTDGMSYTEDQKNLLVAIGQRLSDRLGVLTSIKQLRKSEDRFHDLFKTSPMGLFHLTTEGKLQAANPAMTKIWGYDDPDELLAIVEDIGKQICVDELQFTEMLNAMRQTDDWIHRELENHCKNGGVIVVNMSGRRVQNLDGEIMYFEGIAENITQKRKSQEIVWRQTNFDQLTQLPNRHMFQDRVRLEVNKAKHGSYSLALLLIGLDHFTEVNDTLGHYVGDLLLKEAAIRITDCIPETNSVARLGGDEFTAIMTDPDAIARVDMIAQCIIRTLSAPFQVNEEQVYITASIGITIFPEDTTEADDLLKNADQAIVVAKNDGRNRYAHFTPSLQAAAIRRQQLIRDLRGALAANQFKVYFQPIVDLSSGQIHKAEALLRWMHPERGIVGPSEFIPVTEETGMIIEIGEWVFREAAKWSKRWSAMLNQCIQVSVNKSPVQMHEAMHQLDWVEYLHSQGLTGSNIAVEITEGMLLKAGDDETRVLLGLRDGGIQVAIDDFGTGYSSLAYLNKFDIDYLKIDQSFVSQMTTEPSTMALPEAIIVMAHRLGLKVIAEGIESEQQLYQLKSAGCDYGQGYFFSEPLPPEEFEELLAANY